MPLFHTYKRGVIALEVVFGVTLVALILIFSTHALTRFLTIGSETGDKTEALYLAEEGLEMVRFIRDDAWSNVSSLSNGTNYYLNVTPSAISLSTTATTTGIYTRRITVQPVYRNGSDDIVSSGGTADTGAKIVTATVSWDGGAKTVALQTIVSDLQQ